MKIIIEEASNGGYYLETVFGDHDIMSLGATPSVCLRGLADTLEILSDIDYLLDGVDTESKPNLKLVDNLRNEGGL